MNKSINVFIFVHITSSSLSLHSAARSSPELTLTRRNNEKRNLSGFATAAATAGAPHAVAVLMAATKLAARPKNCAKSPSVVLSIAPSVGVAYGIEHGIFEEHGFDVNYEVSARLYAAGGINSQLDFGVGNPCRLRPLIKA